MKIEETKKLELVQPRERDEEFFQVVDKLISEGINAGDVKKLQDAGISTYSGLMMHTMKNLAGIKGLSEAKVEKICEAAEEILNLGYISDALTKRKSVVESTTESQALDELLRASDSRGPNREKKDMVSSKMATSSQISGPKPPLAYAAGMKQNDGMLASKYWKLMPQGKVHGTLDCFIILEDGILMGADGRATSLYERIGQENLYIFHSDDNPKFLDLLPGIGITFEGDSDRCKQLSQYLEKTVKEQRHHDLESLTRVIVDYLHTHKLKNNSYGISLFLGGFSNEHQDYVVYYLKDREKPAVHKLPYSPYNALGCNTRVAMECFTRDKVHPKMNLNEAVDCMTRALMFSAVADVCIGGELQVYWLTKNSTTRKVYRHCIDQLLDFNYNFDSSSQMFFFSCHPYHLMNYEFLTLCLIGLGIPVGDIPNCLGIVSPGWSMFRVKVHPFHASQLMNNARELRYAAYPSHIRQIAFDMGGVRMIPVLIARASLELLRAVRENSLSSYFGYMGIR